MKPDASAAGTAPQDAPDTALPKSFMGTPRRVSTLSVKADGSVAPGAKPEAGAATGTAPSDAAPAKLASTDAQSAPDAAKPATLPKKHADKPHAKPASASVERRQSRRAGKPMVLQSVVEKQPTQSSAPPPAAAPANPLSSVSGLFRRALETAHIVGAGQQ